MAKTRKILSTGSLFLLSLSISTTINAMDEKAPASVPVLRDEKNVADLPALSLEDGPQSSSALPVLPASPVAEAADAAAVPVANPAIPSPPDAESQAALDAVEREVVPEAAPSVRLPVDLSSLPLAERNKMLLSAAEQDDVDDIQRLLASGADINTLNEANQTALHLAASAGHDAAVRTLLTANPAILFDMYGRNALSLATERLRYSTAKILTLHMMERETGPDGLSLDSKNKFLRAASCIGEVDLANDMLDSGAEIGHLNDEGLRPLDLAACHGHNEIVLLLLGRGADIHAADAYNNLTALHRASQFGHEAIVRTLLEHGANINVQSSVLHYEGFTALHWAALRGREQAARILLEHDADVSMRARDGKTPLHVAAEMGHNAIVISLLGGGSEVDARTGEQYTPLHLAAEGNHADVARTLLENEPDAANIEARTDKGFTPLWLAAAGNDDVVTLLLTRGANIEARDKHGRTPLSFAATTDNESTVSLLLAQGADVNTRTKTNQTPLHTAAVEGYGDVVATLIRSGADINAIESVGQFRPLHTAAMSGCNNVVIALLERGADVNAVASSQKTALHLAAKRGNSEVITTLLDRGANIEARTSDDDAGLTPLLYVALFSGDNDVFTQLLDRGANFRAQDTADHNTALHIAAHYNFAAIVQTLLTDRLDVNVRNGLGETPVHKAARRGNTGIVTILLDNGANALLADNAGATALTLALNKGKRDTAERLSAHMGIPMPINLLAEPESDSEPDLDPDSSESDASADNNQG